MLTFRVRSIFVLGSLLKMSTNCLLCDKKWLLAKTDWSHFLLWSYLLLLWNKIDKEGIQLSLVGLENFLVGRRQSYCFDAVSACWHRLFRMLLFKCKIVLFDSNFTLSPFFRSAVTMYKSLTGCSTQKCFWLPNYSSLVLCQAVSSS